MTIKPPWRRGLACGVAALTLAAGPAATTAQASQQTPPAPTSQHVPPTALRANTAGVKQAASQQIQDAVADGFTALTIDFQYQDTDYWCGPAATRIALSARGVQASQQQMANELGTTVNGTDSITQVTPVLNNNLNTGWYETKQIPDDPPTQAQKDLLWRDITLDIDNGYALVANIVAPANNHPPGYPNYTIYHYLTIIGYNPDTQEVLIADPAGFANTQTYALSFNQTASLIPPKGYSA